MKKLISIFLLLLIGLMQACTGFVEGINDDPNNPTDAPIESVLNAVLVGLIVGNEGHDARVAGMWSGHFTGADRQYSALQVYNASSEDFQWVSFYLAAKNADIVIDKAIKERNPLAQAIAKIVKAQLLGTVTSLYGDIPFSEANRFPEFSHPKFDNQLDVYAALQTMLDEAIALLGGALPNRDAIDAIDFYFGGDEAAWTRVAYSLKARYYLHVGNYASARDAGAKGVYGANDNWTIPHTNGAVGQDMNIYFNFGQLERQGYMDASAATLPDMLNKASALYRGNAKTDESARFAWYYTGAAGAYDLNYDAAYAPDASFTLVGAVENHLIEAEAFARTNDAASALTHLNAARAQLRDDFPAGKYDDYVLADFETGGIANIAGKTAAESLLYEILEEKYCSLTGQIEVFNDLRRTDNLLGIKPSTGTNFPERYMIPQVEVDANNQTPNPIPSLFSPTRVNM